MCMCMCGKRFSYSLSESLAPPRCLQKFQAQYEVKSTSTEAGAQCTAYAALRLLCLRKDIMAPMVLYRANYPGGESIEHAHTPCMRRWTMPLLSGYPGLRARTCFGRQGACVSASSHTLALTLILSALHGLQDRRQQMERAPWWRCSGW